MSSEDVGNGSVKKDLGSQTLKTHSKSASMSQDFVSFGVNEALQEAREIVTEGKARDNPRERLIEDSTTVRVINQGSKNDPIEVVVSRSRVISQPNTDDEQDNFGSYSDSDLPALHKRSSESFKFRAESDDNLIISDGLRSRKTSVRYRRKNDHLWHRDDQVDGVASSDDMEGDDEAQLEVTMNEEACDEDGSHFMRKTWEARWTVQNLQNLPEWLQDNDFLHTGHRPPLPSFAECFKSILSIHTETGNIWTHLLGYTHIQLQEKLVFSFFFGGAILCLGLSFVFHTVSCHSVEIVKVFSKLDYMGISLLTVGSFIPWIYYGFYCRTEPKVTYIAMVSILGLGAIISRCICDYGLSGILPTVHFVITDGVRRLIDENSFYWLLGMAFSILWVHCCMPLGHLNGFFLGSVTLHFTRIKSSMFAWLLRPCCISTESPRWL
uniref:Adiponectin receptor 2 n=1 Tax=Ditylenchus dipsaci TaxID=166011 RepID=A0A915DI12_9BILA